MTTERVLVIDDDREMRVSLSHLLESAGYEVHVVNGGQEGLNALQSNSPDAIISDVRMPEMDGLTFQRKAREISPHFSAWRYSYGRDGTARWRIQLCGKAV